MREFVILFSRQEGSSEPSLREELEHAERLQRLATRGQVIASGPFADGGELLAALFADEASAQAFVDGDPYVQGESHTASIHSWTPARPENGQRGLLPPVPGAWPGFLETLHLRATVREFSPEPVEPELLEAILHAALQAPSDFNVQPWRPLVVTDAAGKAKLQQFCYNQPHPGRAAADVILCVDPTRFHDDAPRVVDERIAKGNLAPSQREPHVASVRSFFRDLPLACMRNGVIFGHQLLLAALSQGLAGAWIGGFKPDPIRKEFAIPEHIVIVGVLALGWPLGVTQPMPKLPAHETLSWGRWGSPRS